MPKPIKSRVAPVKLAVIRVIFCCQAIKPSTTNSGEVCSQEMMAKTNPWEIRNWADSAPQAMARAAIKMEGKVHRAERALDLAATKEVRMDFIYPWEAV